MSIETSPLFSPIGLGALALEHRLAMAPMNEVRATVEDFRRAAAGAIAAGADGVDGLADVVTLGRATLANPDIVERVRTRAPLNEPDPATFYGGDERGYIDYPMLDGVRA